MNTALNTATTKSNIKGLGARALANRADRRDRDERINAVVASAMFSTVDIDNDHEIDSYGRKVRISKPSDIEIAATLRGNRVLDSAELNELLGPDAITKLISNGSLKRDPKHNPKSPCNTYWITVRASEVYGIPAKWAGGFKLAAA